MVPLHTTLTDNPYLPAIYHTLPRLLSLLDGDETSASYGMGDRFYWAWGLIDFENGTFQGMAHGFADLWRHNLWPYAESDCRFIKRIDAIFTGADRLRRRDGSLEEAFPNEGSFCVTALVAYDLLCARDQLQGVADSDRLASWQRIVAPMIDFLQAQDERHAMISNHLATAVAALLRWSDLTGDPKAERRAEEMLERIMAHQSQEGWFEEYGGADPGYQSLCMYYLADVHRRRSSWDLREPLARSVRFLWHFAHPDGSFGGEYGSRCTRFYYPAGMEALADEIPEARALADFMAKSIAEGCVVNLACMDEPNVVPMFNAYCCAAVEWQTAIESEEGVAPSLPSLRSDSERIYWPEAGMVMDRGPDHYTIVGTNRGGSVMHFCEGKCVVNDTGIVVRNRRGRLGSTHAYTDENIVQFTDRKILVESVVSAMSKRLPTPGLYFLFRFLCITVFRISVSRELAKRFLVWGLVSRRRKWPVRNSRQIHLGPELRIDDNCRLGRGYERVEIDGPFVSVHMASKGYWQVQNG